MLRTGAPVEIGARRRAREFFGAPWRAATGLWSALLCVFETRPCSSAASPAGARATSLTEATVRRTGALVALGAVSVLVLILFPAVEELNHGVLAVYMIVLLGCAAVLLSPAHRSVARRAAEIFGAPWHATTELWSALPCVFETRPCSSAASPAGARATSLVEATVRRTGELVALGTVSVLVLLLFPAVDELKHGVLAVYMIVLFGCAAVLLSPAHRAVARRATEIFGASWRAATEPWSALPRVLETRSCIYASSLAGARATSLTEATVRRTGALVALGTVSVLMLLLFPAVEELKHGVLAVYMIVLLGCAAVLLSPAHRAVVRRASEIFGAPWRATTEFWSALPCVFETRPCSSAASLAGTRATSLTEATVRRTGALVALGAVSVLVLILFPAVEELKHGVLAVYMIVLLGCAAVLLSPAHRAVVRRAADIFGAPWRATTEFWSALPCVFETRPCSSAASPGGARATSLAEATVRRTGALVALGAVSVLVLMLFPALEELKHGVLAVYMIVLLGCAAVLLSPAHRAVARRAAEIFGAPWRATTELWSALPRVLEARPCTSASSSAGSSTTSLTEATVRRTGAFMALGGASVLVLVPVHVVVASKNGVLALYAIFLLGCGAVLLSPAHRAVAELARRATRKILLALRPNTVLRWAGFTCIVSYAACAVGDVRVEAAAAKVVSPEKFEGLLLFLLFLVGVWTVSLSMVTGRVPPTQRGGTAPPEARDGVVSKV